MKFYQIKHLSTGLFYTPVRGRPKSNLSELGKVYHKKPALKHISHGYSKVIDNPRFGKGVGFQPRRISVFSKFVEDEWEVVEVEVKE